ncbi:hypothetical protein AR454_16665 [Bacillus mycoides]|uniref:toll/interleukin-1 receptor domain-containing protein n=1 Tax=Bacillus mycoides TaxID=1405 RepID=UPI001E539E3F|nr:toll/interleukin-1 receptor domain-containing protein [Bacillus mycoides]MCD4643720.1 hypothetical protein [Bacillus mycoides]
MSQNDFFISHATADSKLVSELVDFMEIALKVDRNKIYCTSGTGTRKMRTGNNFIENIKENVKGTKVLIFILTPNYFKSNFCLAELGAAWALSSDIYPIIIPPTPRKLLKSTPLSESTQALTLNTYEDLITMADEFEDMNFAKYSSVKVLNERAHKLIDWLDDNCSFDIDDTVSKAEYLAVQSELENLKKSIHQKEMEQVSLVSKYESMLTFEREEREKIIKQSHEKLKHIDIRKMIDSVKGNEEEITDKWDLFNEHVKNTKSVLSKLNDIVISAIYHDEFHRGTSRFWPRQNSYLNWSNVQELELKHQIRVDEDHQQITPNYEEYLVGKAVDKLHDFSRYITVNINEEMEQEFAEENEFNLEFTSQTFWEKFFDVIIYV